jgi:hypothetical protein
VCSQDSAVHSRSFDVPSQVLTTDSNTQRQQRQPTGGGLPTQVYSHLLINHDVCAARAGAAPAVQSSSSADQIESPISGYSSSDGMTTLTVEHRQNAHAARPWSSTDNPGGEPVPFRPMHKTSSYGGPSGTRATDARGTVPVRGRSDVDTTSACLPRQPSIPECGVPIYRPLSVSTPLPPHSIICAVSSLDQVPPGAIILQAPPQLMQYSVSMRAHARPHCTQYTELPCHNGDSGR